MIEERQRLQREVEVAVGHDDVDAGVHGPLAVDLLDACTSVLGHDREGLLVGLPDLGDANLPVAWRLAPGECAHELLAQLLVALPAHGVGHLQGQPTPSQGQIDFEVGREVRPSRGGRL